MRAHFQWRVCVSLRLGPDISDGLLQDLTRFADFVGVDLHDFVSEYKAAVIKINQDILPAMVMKINQSKPGSTAANVDAPKLWTNFMASLMSEAERRRYSILIPSIGCW